MAVISILFAALFFHRRRRRSLVSSPVFDGNIAFDPHWHMDPVSPSTSSQGTISSYVHIFILSSSSACVSSHNYLFSLTLSTWITQLCTLSTRYLRHRQRTSLVKHLPYRPAEVYTLLGPYQAPKHREITASQLPDFTL